MPLTSAAMAAPARPSPSSNISAAVSGSRCGGLLPLAMSAGPKKLIGCRAVRVAALLDVRAESGERVAVRLVPLVDRSPRVPVPLPPLEEVLALPVHGGATRVLDPALGRHVVAFDVVEGLAHVLVVRWGVRELGPPLLLRRCGLAYRLPRRSGGGLANLVRV